MILFSINQGQFTEAAAFPNSYHFLSIDINLKKLNFCLNFWPLKRVWKSYLDFSRVNDVKVISFVTLLNNDLSGNGRYGKHGIEDVWSLVLVQMWKKDVFGNCLRQWGHGLVVFWDHLKKIRDLLIKKNLSQRKRAFQTLSKKNRQIARRKQTFTNF